MKNVREIFILMLIAVSLVAKAQVQELTKLSEIVIEGEVISTEPKWNENRNLIFTENKVLIKSVFKGQIRDSIINIRTDGGIIENLFHYKTHEISISVGDSGYFFVNPDNSSNLNYFTDERTGFVQVHDQFNKYVVFFGEKVPIREFDDQIIK